MRTWPLALAACVALVPVRPAASSSGVRGWLSPWSDWSSARAFVLLECEASPGASGLTTCRVTRRWKSGTPDRLELTLPSGAPTRHVLAKLTLDARGGELRSRPGEQLAFDGGAVADVRLYLDEVTAANAPGVEPADAGASFWAAMERWADSDEPAIRELLRSDLCRGSSPFGSMPPSLHVWATAAVRETDPHRRGCLWNLVLDVTRRSPTDGHQAAFCKVVAALGAPAKVRFLDGYPEGRLRRDDLVVALISGFAESGPADVRAAARRARDRLGVE